jgi:hypothetical protein
VRSGIVLVLGALACGDRTPPPPVPRDALPHRTIEPPSVRPLPPYLITATEVGPYKLGQSLYAMPTTQGANSSRFHIERVLNTNLTHTEDNMVLIGSEIGAPPTRFVAVLDGDVARTESGLHVGRTRKELEGITLAQDVETARDPRLLAPASPRGMRLVLDRDRVVAMVILGDDGAKPKVDGPDCARPAPVDGRFGTCMASGETIEVDGEEIAVHVTDGDKDKIIAQVRVPGLVFAAPLRNAGEGRDELFAVAMQGEANQRTWTLTGFRIDGGRRVTVVETAPLYQILATETRWFGVELRDIELYLELASRPDGIEVGGLLTTRVPRVGRVGAPERTADKIRDLLVISPVTIPRRRTRPITPTDAGVPDDASPEPLNAPGSSIR